MKANTIKDFWNRVDKTDYCWNWKGTIIKDGYGIFNLNCKKILAHRFSYELKYGKIPYGLELDHLCRNTQCINPDHLEPVTHRENVLRGESLQAINARKIYCKNGHKFTKDNIIEQNNGKRCKKCYFVYQKIYHKTYTRFKVNKNISNKNK